MNISRSTTVIDIRYTHSRGVDDPSIADPGSNALGLSSQYLYRATRFHPMIIYILIPCPGRHVTYIELFINKC